MANSSPLLRGILGDIKSKKVLVPIIRSMLADPKFRGFNLKVEPWQKRKYDGRFHPSSHATWTARQLTYYLTHGDQLIEEKPTPGFVLAVTQGKFWHSFYQKLLLRNGILEQDEVPLHDELHNRTGHTDGRLSNGELLEIKTASSSSFKKLGDVDALKEYSFGYYGQTQDYLDMAGAEIMRYLVVCMESPYPMHEYLVPADGVYQLRQRRKYREAIEAAQSGDLPDPCCSARSLDSTRCPVRLACPVGEGSL